MYYHLRNISLKDVQYITKNNTRKIRTQKSYYRNIHARKLKYKYLIFG